VAFAGGLPGGSTVARLNLPLTDGYETGVYAHEPSRPAGLPVLYLHGIQSHPGWFVASAAAMAGAGHWVFQVMRRGSGDNASFRGDAASAGQLLRDVQTACEWVLARTGTSGLHLIGVSWGGKLAACYAAWAKRSVRLASLTLVAPGIVPRVDLSPLRKLAVAVCWALWPGRLFEVPLNDVGLFTDNEEMQAFLRRDAHRLLRVTARFLCVSRGLDMALRRARRGVISVQTTLILASRDRIIDNERTAREVNRLTAGSAVTVTLDGAHTLEFEPDPRAFHATLLEALKRTETRL
jgi:alpha-beta hydrolase superfamily lysophospholipase